jgi:dipeptidyl aminopeptidase/acylaminoacyl peptidase
LIVTVAPVYCFAAAGESEKVRDHDIVPEDGFDIASVVALKVSPDGRLAAFVESRWGKAKEGRKRDLWVVDLQSREPLRLTFGGFGANRPVWSPDGTWIYFAGRSRRAGETEPPHDGTSQVWRVKPSGGDPFPVTRVDKGIKHFALGDGGRTLIYTTSEEVYEEEWKDLRKASAHLEYGHGIVHRNAIWKLDLVSWRSEKLRAAESVIHAFSLSPDGSKIAMTTTPDNEIIFMEGWSEVVVLDLESGKIETVTSPGWRKDHPSPYGWLEEISWSGDGQSLAFSVAFDGYPTRLYVAEWKKWQSESASLWELERPGLLSLAGGLKWRGAGRTLCFLAEERARQRACAIESVRDESQGRLDVLTPGDVVCGSFDFDASGRTMAAVVETTTHLNEIFVMKDGDYERITDLNPQTERWKMPQISIFSYAGADGDSVEGILELPPGYKKEDGPLPLVVELHGGPTGSTKLRLRLWIYGRTVMAARGYALFSPNYHGSTGYGDEFMTKLIGRENDIEVADVTRGIEALIAQGYADRDRIGVMGWSNGGYLTNCMITARPDLFKVASSGAGVLDMVIQWGTEDTPGHVINYMRGLPWERPEAYIKGSPLYKLNRVKTPTLIHVGGSDPRVPPAHSRALYRALRHYLKVPVELIVYPGQSHSLSTHENRLAKIKWDLAWFDKYLGARPGK